METETARRPLKTRQAAWANRLAQLLVKWHASPNGISLASIFFAAGNPGTFAVQHAGWHGGD
jgi:hypothetical protein